MDRKDLICIGSDWRKYQATTVSEEDSQRPSHLTYKIGANVETKVERNAMMETGRFDRYGEVDPLIEFAKSYWAFNHNHREYFIKLTETAIMIRSIGRAFLVEKRRLLAALGAVLR